MHFTRLYPDRTPINFKAIFCDAKSLKCLAPRAGFEPATNRLTVASMTKRCDPLYIRRMPIGALFCGCDRSTSGDTARRKR